MGEYIAFTNEFMSPKFLKKLKIKYRFISLIITNGKLYKNNETTFYLESDDLKRIRGNKQVLGVLYYLPNFIYDIRKLDALMNCSLSHIKSNKNFDVTHRIKKSVSLITPTTLYDLQFFRVKRVANKTCWFYKGNVNNKLVQNAVKYHKKIKEGVDIIPFQDALIYFKGGKS